MAKGRRVGGTGWAGVHGSFIGLSNGKSSSRSNVRIGKPKKKPAPPPKVDLSTLPENLEVQQAARRVETVQIDILATKKRLKSLENQLSALLEALKVAVDLARPIKPRKAPAGPTGQAGKSKKSPRNGKQSPADRLAENLARKNYRNAPKEVEVEHRAGGVVVGKRTVERS
jgi:hypothetical protein